MGRQVEGGTDGARIREGPAHCEGSTTRRNGMATLGWDDGDPLILDVV
jgi:hypothetical protein